MTNSPVLDPVEAEWQRTTGVARLIFNRDLRGSDVPDFEVGTLEPPGGGHALAWVRVWRFALSFDPSAYTEATAIPIDGTALLAALRRREGSDDLHDFHLSELRAALWALYWELGQGATASAEDASLIDALLDAIHARVARGRRRPRGDPGPLEPGLGTFGATVGSGQHRFLFVPRERLDRVALYDRVAGLLLREASADVVVSALYLYPPTYALETDAPAVHTFMLLLEPRERDSVSTAPPKEEYGRLQQLVIDHFADRTEQHWPEATR